MWCTRGKARESTWDTYTTVEDIVRRKAFLLWEVATTDSSASTCLLPRYQWYQWCQCQDSTPPVKVAESDVLGKALGFMSFMLKTKFCAHSHGWHQWSGTLVAAMRSIFYLSDRGWRNQWISRTERGLSTINLETLKMCRKPLNQTRFDQKSRETGTWIQCEKWGQFLEVDWKSYWSLGLTPRFLGKAMVIPSYPLWETSETHKVPMVWMVLAHTLPIKLAPLHVSQSVLALACNEGATRIWERVFMTLLSFTPKMPTLWHCAQKCPKPPPLHLAPVAMHLCLWPFHPCS